MRFYLLAVMLFGSVSHAESPETREVPVSLLEDLKTISESYVYEGHHNVLSRQELLLMVYQLLEMGMEEKLESIVVEELMSSKEELKKIGSADNAAEVHKQRAAKLQVEIESLK